MKRFKWWFYVLLSMLTYAIRDSGTALFFLAVGAYDYFILTGERNEN